MGKRILSYILAILKLIVIAAILFIVSVILVLIANKFQFGVSIIGILLLLVGVIGSVISMADDIYKKLSKLK